MTKLIKLSVVKGSEGFALNLINETGNGIRLSGPKPWGNPYNIPTTEFTINADELIDYVRRFSYEQEVSNV